MYVEDLLNNVEQHTNIDLNNDVDNPGLNNCLVLYKICLAFCEE